ncbi:unnamed protein product [Moneuplotes crassus]|uniref:Uncharacterized protein n=1 Tax=Euplotes crassus TaxID=5936 RepID=A0AAD1Y6D4_EUPCR|nr:unnamed protein product [Moneuplotes crassus]
MQYLPKLCKYSNTQICKEIAESLKIFPYLPESTSIKFSYNFEECYIQKANVIFLKYLTLMLQKFDSFDQTKITKKTGFNSGLNTKNSYITCDAISTIISDITILTTVLR